MSTRSHIAFFEGKPEESDREKPDALLYRHCDGYPTGMMPELIPMLQKFHRLRGLSNTDYAAARIMQWLCNKADEAMAKQKKDGEEDVYDCIGYGFDYGRTYHSDVEFVYLVYADGIIESYSVNFWERHSWHHIGTADITSDMLSSAEKIMEYAQVLEAKQE